MIADMALKKRKLDEAREKEKLKQCDADERESESEESGNSEEEEANDVEDCDDELMNARRFFALTECFERFFIRRNIKADVLNIKQFDGKPHMLVTMQNESQAFFKVVFLHFLPAEGIFTDIMEALKFCECIKMKDKASFGGIYISLDSEIKQLDSKHLIVLQKIYPIKGYEIINGQAKNG